MMPNDRRSQTPGGRYFFTVITYRRHPLLTDPESRRILREAIIGVRRECPFQIEAWVCYCRNISIACGHDRPTTGIIQSCRD